LLIPTYTRHIYIICHDALILLHDGSKTSDSLCLPT
jgi:hypothetical protein